MLNKVPKINYDACYPSRLKRIFRNDINYLTYEKFVPYSKNQTVGNIPIEIIRLFKDDKCNKIKWFQQGMANIANYLRGCYLGAKKENIISYGFSDLDDKDLKIFERQITLFANKQFKNVLPKDISVNLKYKGKGAWGNVFHFSMSDKKGNKIMSDKALKIYHKKFGGVSCLSYMHGCCAEANFWTFIKYVAGHNLDKTQFTKHYISDLKSGYSLTEFASLENLKNIFPLDLRKIFRLESLDTMNEPICGKFYDAGGYAKALDFISDKVTFKYFKKLMHRSEKELPSFLKSLQQYIQNPKTPHRDKIQKAIELFENQKQINNNIV